MSHPRSDNLSASALGFLEKVDNVIFQFIVYSPGYSTLQRFTLPQLIMLRVSMSGGALMVCVCVCVLSFLFLERA